jgi:hypothetical protein
MTPSRDSEFPMSFVDAAFCVVHLAKDRRLGLNVFANQLYNVFSN